MKTNSKVSGGSEPLKKAIGAAKRQSGHQKVSIFFACNTKLGLLSSTATSRIQVAIVERMITRTRAKKSPLASRRYVTRPQSAIFRARSREPRSSKHERKKGLLLLLYYIVEVTHKNSGNDDDRVFISLTLTMIMTDILSEVVRLKILC